MKPNTFGRNRWNFKFLKLFLEKGAVHGLPYVGRGRLTVLERVLWLILTLIALYLSIDLGLESLDRFKTKSTVISIERDYHYWNTTFTSATICPFTRLSKEKFQKYCAERNIIGDDRTELFEFLESLANSTYFNFNNIKSYPSIEKHNIEPKDYMYLIYNLTNNLVLLPRSSRVHAIVDSMYIHTQQVLTEWGICYTANNYLSEELSVSNLLLGEPPSPDPSEENENFRWTFSVNVFDGESILHFMGFTGRIEIYLHGAYEVMSVERRLGSTEIPLECVSRVYDIIASEDFEKSTTVEQRQCRFPHESNLTHFPIYTRNLCLQECRINLAYRLCKCIPHFYPNREAKKPVCHYKTLKECLFKYANVFENLNEIKNLTLDKDAISCHCLPNCRSSEVLERQAKPLTKAGDLLKSNGVMMVMKNLPLLRYRRQIIFTLTDLLVSVGGTAGFFLGCSVLSAIEIIYYFTVRLIWHCFGYKE